MLALFLLFFFQGSDRPFAPPDPHAADSLYQQGLYPQAAEAYQAVAEAWQKLHQDDSTRYYQLRTARAYVQDYDLDNCERWVHRALEDRGTGAPLWAQSIGYNELGYIQLLGGEYEAALALYQKSIEAETRRPAADTLNLAKSYEFQGLTYMALGDLEQAQRWVEEAHHLRQLILDPWNKELGYSANGLYMVYSQAGNLPRADTAMAQAWRILNKQLPKDHPHLALLANNYSTIKSSLGDITQAKELLLKAITLNKTYSRERATISNYNNLGGLHLTLLEPDAALRYFFQGLALADTLLPHPHLNRVYLLDGVGAAYYLLDSLRQADSVFRLALTEKRALLEEDHPELAQSWYNLGTIAQERNLTAEARRDFQRAEALYRASWGPDHPKRADALFELGELAWAEHDSLPARALWQEALRLYRTHLGFSHSYVAETALQLAESYQYARQDSLDFYLRMAWGSASGQDAPVRSRLLDSLTLTLLNPRTLDLISFELALLTQEVAPTEAPRTYTAQELTRGHHLMDIAERWIPAFLSLSKQERGSDATAELVQSIYTRGALFAHRALQQHPDDVTLRQLLLTCMQASRGATIQAAFRHRQAIQFAGVPDTLVEHGRQLMEALRYQETKWQKSDEESVSAQRELYLAALQAWQEYQRELERTYPRYYQMRYETPSVSWEKVQQALAPDESMLTYLKLDSNLLVVLVDRETFSSQLLALPTSWPDSVYRYRQLLAQRGDPAEVARLSHSLYTQLWAPFADRLNKRVRLLPDGPLYYLNFETLLEQPVTAQSTSRAWPYLIRRHAIYYAYTLPGVYPTAEASPGTILGIAPGFSPELKAHYRQQLPPETAVDSVFLGWVRTPWSVQLVDQLAQRGWGTALTENNATERRFLAEAPSAGILHFGTHAQLISQNPLESFLALTPEPTDSADGYLHTYELYGQPFHAQLAVLTACQTGLGRYQAGEGVLSLAHAFRYAGCPSVIYSLWSIDDEQTNQLTEFFYEEVRQGRPFGDALRQAKLRYLDQQPAALQLPFYWASLVLAGENQALPMPSFWETYGGWLLGGLVVLGLTALWVYRKKRASATSAHQLQKN
ncbi:CHAT domain-containing protein [Catalinimonas alkaloidigena]|uniref:CHAT domain-containing protein n=1 Tax=Catalinimonas alkaloidigena TaxID=1075417 RepID=UPI000B7EBF87|nr:CHAT domain-containing protein [Catalinimonas alkaloidigena]